MKCARECRAGRIARNFVGCCIIVPRKRERERDRQQRANEERPSLRYRCAVVTARPSHSCQRAVGRASRRNCLNDYKKTELDESVEKRGEGEQRKELPALTESRGAKKGIANSRGR